MSCIRTAGRTLCDSNCRRQEQGTASRAGGTAAAAVWRRRSEPTDGPTARVSTASRVMTCRLELCHALGDLQAVKVNCFRAQHGHHAICAHWSNGILQRRRFNAGYSYANLSELAPPQPALYSSDPIGRTWLPAKRLSMALAASVGRALRAAAACWCRWRCSANLCSRHRPPPPPLHGALPPPPAPCRPPGLPPGI